MNKAVFISEVNKNWKLWTDLLDQLNSDEKLVPLGFGIWSAKDLVAHMAWYEREMVDMVMLHKLVGSDWWNLPRDERNEKIYLLNSDRSMQEITSESKSIHDQLLASLQTLTDEDLVNSSNFSNMPPDWIPWKIIASNTCEHYVEHIPDLKMKMGQNNKR